jgi:BirA family biotin operon repressor/biotin-[acetyl-CoA-carboxylase] ligase
MERFKSIYYIHFDSIDSTNTWAKNHAHELDRHQLTCITAMEQTAGQGRWNRRWISPKNQNIYATLYFCLPRSCPYIHNLGQILSLSCATVLKKKGFSPEIKWPNDLLLLGKKVAGILTELVVFNDSFGVVLGIGINTNMSEELLNTIDQPATSLTQLSGQTWTIEQILEPLLQQFIEDLSTLITHGFQPFQVAYQELLAYKGQVISSDDGSKRVSGTCLSVNAEGRLNLLLSSGEILEIVAGEIKFTAPRTE